MQKKLATFLLPLIIVISFFIRFPNISPFKFYPDAYQSLIVSESIAKYHSVFGYLGDYGSLYPDFFMWTRPGYPLLIDLFMMPGLDRTATAQSIAFFAGVLAVPLAYFFIKRVFQSKGYGLVAALLVALSFNHTVWSGYIMTETTGIFFILAFLASLFSNLEKKVKLADFSDLLTGVLLACAILTRYEYIILIFPLLFLLFTKSKTPHIKLITIVSSALLVISVVVSVLFPVTSLIGIIVQQLKDLLVRGVVIGVVLSILFAFLYFFPREQKKHLIHGLEQIVLYAFLLFMTYIILQIIFPLEFLRYDLTFVRDFFIHDFVITFFFVIGTVLILKNKTFASLGYFALISAVALGYTYHRVNPEMDRYLTHLVPFLLIPASFGFIEAITFIRVRFQKRKGIQYLIFAFVGVLFLFQTYRTYFGIQNEQNHSWFRTDYEEKAAHMIKKYIPNNSYLLIVSFPESYYYFSGVSTHSITDAYPYLYIDPSLDDRNVLVISDMGMYHLFPHFAEFLDKNLQKEKIAKFWVGEDYHYSNRSEKEKYPLTLYKIKLGDLKSRINEQEKH